MKYKIKTESLEGLISNLRSFTSKNRDSITDEDVDLLNECIRHLELFKDSLESEAISLEHVSKAIEILLRVFTVAEKVQDFFDLI